MYLISMSSTTIIWDTISTIVKDDHPIMYQYIKGRVRSRESAVRRLTGLIAPIFVGAYEDSRIRSEVRDYLKQKEADYKNGLVKIKPIHY
jgi:hypothetical protein